MKVLVTGAKGMLGQDLCSVLEMEGFSVIPSDCATLDVTNEKMVEEAIAETFPDLIIHCAAYTNVDKAESDYDNAYKINVEGTRNVAKSAAKHKVALVYISTDYVFDGEKELPYVPTDVANPINVYGKTKYLGEQEVLKYCERYYIVRTSWLYGKHGKNFVDTMLELAKTKDELKVVNDQFGSPTWTMDLSRAIIKLFNMAFGIYHLSGGKQTTWYNFAKEIFKIEKIDIKLIPCTTEEFPRDAKRPKHSFMDNGGMLRDWGEALFEYLQKRKGE